MSIIEDELTNALHPAVKRKANRTGQLKYRQQAGSVTKYAPEVMVKITGFGHGGGHVMAHLQYISRNGKLELETDRGDVLCDKSDIKDYFDNWNSDFKNGRSRKDQRDTMHMVLSMPEGTSSEAVRLAVRDFAQKTFGKNHEYVFVLHEDQLHPHCHLTVNCRGHDGRRLNPRKHDLQAWREGFAEAMRYQGEEAEASPRRSRGVVRKPEKQVVRHIEAGDKTHKPRVPKAKAARIREAAQELAGTVKAREAPWDSAIAERQRAIRAAWLSAADHLDKPLSPLRFTNPEKMHERPRYEEASDIEIQRGIRAAGLYQSNLGAARPFAKTQSGAGMRSLSGSPLVQHQRASKVLLQADAHASLGRDGTADSLLRRPRDSDIDAQRRLDLSTGSTPDNKAQAARIRAFVAAMPAVETERLALMRGLREKFARSEENSPTQSPSRGDLER